MIIAYVDNSVLSELRFNNKSNENRISLIIKIMEKYNIESKNILLTDKLFLEIIGYGSIRRKIVNYKEAVINEEKNRLIDKGFSQANIKIYTSFLENFFNLQIRNNLPQYQVYLSTKENLKKYPFVASFTFEIPIIQYAENITNFPKKYEDFVSGLVIDSVVRYSLNFNNKIDDDCFFQILKFLQQKYPDYLYDNLLLLMTGLKSYYESLRKIKDQPRLLRLKDDFADAEPQQLVFYGKAVKGAHHPITFLTSEKIESIKQRLDYYFAGIIEIVNNKPNYNKQLCIGRTIVINFEKFIYDEIRSELYLRKLPEFCYIT